MDSNVAFHILGMYVRWLRWCCLSASRALDRRPGNVNVVVLFAGARRGMSLCCSLFPVSRLGGVIVIGILDKVGFRVRYSRISMF